MVDNSVFFDNHSSEFGGGILNETGTLTVTRSIFDGNSAQGALGGGIDNGGTATVTSSTFAQNSALSGNGGGIENENLLTVTNSTFFKNRGGGIVSTLISANFLNVTDSTLSKNYDGGIVGAASLKTTILAANEGGDCVKQSGFPGVTDAGYNIADDSTCGFSATGSFNSTDPKLDPRGLRKNGGPTKTIALESDSPAIDAVPISDCTDQASPPSRITTDERGFPRPDHHESVCDIGAFESQHFDGSP